MITSDNIREIATGQGDDYTTGCLLDYNYFTNYYKRSRIGKVSNHTCPLDGLASHTTLIISNEEIIVFMKIIRSLEASLY